MSDVDIMQKLYIVTCINSGMTLGCLLFLAAMFLWPKDGAEPNG